MKQNDVFPSNFLKSEDLHGKAARVTIERVTLEKIGEDKKPILHFVGKSKMMVCNKTNWGVLVNITGQEDSDHWGGWSIGIYSAKVAYQGKMVDGLRVDDRPGAAKPPHARNQSTEPATRNTAAPRTAVPPVVEDETGGDFDGDAYDSAPADALTDDEIPF